MTPAELYQARSPQQSLSRDPQTERVLKYLDRLAQALVPEATTERGFLGKIFGGKTAPAGLYLWGGVGAGKTMLMDIFYETLPFPEKKRTHFHHFMQTVHSQLKQLRRSDPLQQVAQHLADKC